MCMTLALAVQCTQVAVVHACSVSHCWAVVYRCMASYSYMSTVHGDVRVLYRNRKRKRGANADLPTDQSAVTSQLVVSAS